MRVHVAVAFAAFSLCASSARAQQLPVPLYPYDVNTPIAPAAEAPAPTWPPPAAYLPPPAWAPPPAPYPMPPYPSYPPPAYYPPPVYYPPPTLYGPPGYPPGVLGPAPSTVNLKRPRTCTGSACSARCAKWCPERDRARYFSIGGRATSLTLNQQIGNDTVTLGGGGFELRFRGRGRFGLEASIDFLHADFTLNGPIARDSIPFQLSALLYVFPNSDRYHFNMYLLSGFGVIGTTMTLTDENNQQVKQDFTEYEAHLGLGLELRLKWFAVRADVRGLALWRDDSSAPAALYGSVEGAPVPEQSWGVQGTLGANIWF